MPPTRFPVGLRRLGARTPPVTVLLTGPAATAAELAAVATPKLSPVEIVDLWGNDIAAALQAMAVQNGYRSRRLIRWAGFGAVEPDTALLDAIRTMKPQRGVWLLAHTTEAPPEAVAGVFAAVMNCRLSEAEARTWVQTRLGGAPVTAALELLAAVDGDLDEAGGALAAVGLVARTATPGDIADVVAPQPEPRFVSELLGLRRGEAMAHAGRLSDPSRVLAELTSTLLVLWALTEARPPVQRRSARDVAGALGLKVETVADLAPLVRLYSRQKLRTRLEALAIADAQLRRGMGAKGVIEVLVACW